MIRKTLVSGFFLFFAAVCGSANAALYLRIENVTGNTGVILKDDDGDGFLMFSGALGQFTINVTTAISKPALGGSYNYSEMDLSDVTVNSSGAGELRISFVDTNFVEGPNGSHLGFNTLFGGTLNSLRALSRPFSYHNVRSASEMC